MAASGRRVHHLLVVQLEAAGAPPERDDPAFRALARHSSSLSAHARETATHLRDRLELHARAGHRGAGQPRQPAAAGLPRRSDSRTTVLEPVLRGPPSALGGHPRRGLAPRRHRGRRVGRCCGGPARCGRPCRRRLLLVSPGPTSTLPLGGPGGPPGRPEGALVLTLDHALVGDRWAPSRRSSVTGITRSSRCAPWSHSSRGTAWTIVDAATCPRSPMVARCRWRRAVTGTPGGCGSVIPRRRRGPRRPSMPRAWGRLADPARRSASGGGGLTRAAALQEPHLGRMPAPPGVTAQADGAPSRAVTLLVGGRASTPLAPAVHRRPFDRPSTAGASPGSRVPIRERGRPCAWDPSG